MSMALPGPLQNRVVLHRELVWAARSIRLYFPRYIAVVVVFFICVLSSPAPVAMPMRFVNRWQGLEVDTLYMRRWVASAEADQAYHALNTCLQWQLILLVLITPAVTAGALGHEKEQDTLIALLGTE